MARVSFRGEPYVVDIVLRPVLSGARWIVGVGLGALCWYLDWTLLVPVPLLVATALVEGWLLVRSDRPVRIDLDEDRVVVDDRFAATLTIFRDRVQAITVLWQPRNDGGQDGVEVVVALASERRVLLALAAQVVRPPPMPAAAVDVALYDELLGARAGLLRAMAPPGRICRQRVRDGAVVDALHRWAEPSARACQAVRLWAGPDPDLTPFGLHPHDASGVLLLAENGWSLTDDDGTRTGPRHTTGWSMAEREAVLFGVGGDADPAPGVLPLLVIALVQHNGDGLWVAIPAPGRGGPAYPAAGPELHHAQAPEGAVLLAWLDAVGALPSDLAGPSDREPSHPLGDTPPAGPREPTR